MQPTEYTYLVFVLPAQSVKVRGMSRDWRRPPRRPHHTRLHTLEADFQPHNLGLTSPWRYAQNRTRWKHLCLQFRRSSYLEQFTTAHSKSAICQHLQTTLEDLSVLLYHCHWLTYRTIRTYDSNPVWHMACYKCCLLTYLLTYLSRDNDHAPFTAFSDGGWWVHFPDLLQVRRDPKVNFLELLWNFWQYFLPARMSNQQCQTTNGIIAN